MIVEAGVWTCPSCTDTTRNDDPAVLAEVQRSHGRRHRREGLRPLPRRGQR